MASNAALGLFSSGSAGGASMVMVPSSGARPGTWGNTAGAPGALPWASGEGVWTERSTSVHNGRMAMVALGSRLSPVVCTIVSCLYMYVLYYAYSCLPTGDFRQASFMNSALFATKWVDHVRRILG